MGGDRIGSANRNTTPVEDVFSLGVTSPLRSKPLNERYGCSQQREPFTGRQPHWLSAGAPCDACANTPKQRGTDRKQQQAR